MAQRKASGATSENPEVPDSDASATRGKGRKKTRDKTAYYKDWYEKNKEKLKAKKARKYREDAEKTMKEIRPGS